MPCQNRSDNQRGLMIRFVVLNLELCPTQSGEISVSGTFVSNDVNLLLIPPMLLNMVLYLGINTTHLTPLILVTNPTPFCPYNVYVC
jgi:hypothetical protein